MNWKSIRLELGSTGDFPSGSVSRAILVNLPLDDSDIVDGEALARTPSKATARRHWSSEPDERGHIVQFGAAWAMRCNGKPDRLLLFDGRPVRLGQQVSVIEHDGKILPLKVTSVR